MRTQILFYHVVMNFAWMQANLSRKFLFAGICGCPGSVEGASGVLVNTQPIGRCQFCNRTVEMGPLLAYSHKNHQWLQLYKTQEGQFATRTPTFASGTESPSPAGSPAVHPSS